ncbi:MAG: hypothetical protein ABI473_12665 [Candidatus Dormibacter sp.]
MGLTFRSGDVLGLRCWPASSIGPPCRSIWHRNSAGRWTFYQDQPDQMACTRYFGADVDVVVTGPIEVTWKGERQLNVRAGGDAGVDWVIELGSSVVSRAMSAVASALPERAWRSGPVLAMMSRVVGSVLGVGRVRLTGRTPNGHQFVVNPRPIWWVTRSSATIASENLVPIGPLQEQAHLADFWIPQRGLFMVGGARLRARQPVEKGFTGQDATHVHQMTSRRLPCPEKQ